MPLTAKDILEKKNKQKITMITCYDYSFGKLIEEVGFDMVLVGDSLGGVIKGEETTIKVELKDMIYHTNAVAKAIRNSLIVADMPFLTYRTSQEDALRAGGLLIKAGAGAVKLEGTKEIANTVRFLTENGIAVVAHIGLLPQFFYKIGGYRVVGKSASEREFLIESALALEAGGAFAIVLECIVWDVAKQITERLKIPTIGCGAGPFCDGQVLVLHDVLGLSPFKKPKFVREYVNLKEIIKSALNNFKKDIIEERFPLIAESYGAEKESFS